MTETIHVRPITETDIEGFRAAVDFVARELLYLSRPEGPSAEGAAEFVRGNLAKADPHFVAIDNDQVVGWCDINRSEGPFERHVGSMGMGLLPAFRGRGLGRTLLQATLDAAAAVEMTRELTVHASNTRAIALYDRLGFVQEGRLQLARLIDNRYEDIILMARLDPSLTV